MRLFYKFIFSSLSGITATITFLIISSLLDKIINDKISNGIGLIFGAFVNFILQSKTFIGKNIKYSKYITKYIISEIFILGANQLIETHFLNNKNIYIKYLPKEYRDKYNTLSRSATGVIVWTLISFPLRNLFVFV